MAKDRPQTRRGKPAASKPTERPQTEVIRIPADFFEMIDTAAQHYHTSPAGILSREDCPLRAWLEKLYVVVIDEKRARAEAQGRKGGA